MMSIAPEISIDFGPCPVGDHMNRPCTLKNSSTVLPIIFHFRRIAHFIPYPQHGTIQPGDSMDIVLSYKPAQMGKTNQHLSYFCLQVEVLSFSPSIRHLHADTVHRHLGSSGRQRKPVRHQHEGDSLDLHESQGIFQGGHDEEACCVQPRCARERLDGLMLWRVNSGCMIVLLQASLHSSPTKWASTRTRHSVT